MKRIALLLLAWGLLLSACGRIASETETTAAPYTGESDGVRWRILDVNSDEGREAVQWLSDEWEQQQKGWDTQFPMGEDKTLVTRSDGLVLRDNKTGRETTLLKKVYLGEEATPEEALMREEAWKYPRFIQALDERYFVYCWGYWEGSGEPGVYDTKNMRTIAIAYDAEYMDRNWFTGQQLIFADAIYLSEGSYGPYGGPLHLMRVDLTTLEGLREDEPLMAFDVLAEIPGDDVTEMNSRFVTPDERYFILNDIDGVRVYDLLKNSLVHLPVAGFGSGAERMAWGSDLVQRGNLVYWTDRHGGYNYLAEITLP